MKRTVVTVTVVFAALGFAIFVAAPKSHMLTSSTAIAAPAPVPLAEPLPARCPNIHEAIDALQSAEGTLRNAGHDFCGHKVAAMRTVHDAIEQLRAAEACDRCR